MIIRAAGKANEGEREAFHLRQRQTDGRARKKNGITAFYMDGSVLTWLNENGNGSDERLCSDETGRARGRMPSLSSATSKDKGKHMIKGV